MTTQKIKIISSSAFFMLFLFTALSLITSQFSSSFTRLFMIFSRNDHVYDFLTTLFCLAGFLAAAAFVIYALKNKIATVLHIITAFVLAALFLAAILLLYAQNLTHEDILNSLVESAKNRDFFALSFGEPLRLPILCAFYAAFIYFPLLCDTFALRPNAAHPLGRFLASLKPSQNIIIIALFASAFQPFFMKSSIYAYADLAAFVLGFALFWRQLGGRKNLSSMNFYEALNFIILLCGIVLFVTTSAMLAGYSDYYNARLCFIALVAVCWCFEWMGKSVFV